MARIRVLIADDHAEFRRGLRGLIASEADVEIVGEAATGTEAARVVQTLQPDVVLMDLKMPDLNGIEASRIIVDRSPHVRVVLLTMYEDEQTLAAALQAGVRGYLLKGAVKAEVLRAIRAVANGETIFGPVVSRHLLHHFSAESTEALGFSELSNRERQVFSLMAQHYTNREIARALGLAEKTVRNHVSNIFTKLQVVDRTEAIMLAGRRHAPLVSDT